MAFETILHSGSFNDYNGEEIKVTFYRRVDLNASPTSLTYYKSGGAQILSIWSRAGDAELFDPPADWIWHRQVKAEEYGDYHKYTYEITCDPNNTGKERKVDLSVGIEGMGGVRITIPVIQYNTENN